MPMKGTGTPSGGKPKKQSSQRGKRSETKQHPLVQLGEEFIREGKLTREQFAKLLYEGPEVGP